MNDYDERTLIDVSDFLSTLRTTITEIADERRRLYELMQTDASDRGEFMKLLLQSHDSSEKRIDNVNQMIRDLTESIHNVIDTSANQLREMRQELRQMQERERELIAVLSSEQKMNEQLVRIIKECRQSPVVHFDHVGKNDQN